MNDTQEPLIEDELWEWWGMDAPTPEAYENYKANEADTRYTDER